MWQGLDAGGGIWAQVRNAAGAGRGAPLAVAAAGGVEGEPAVAARAGGRFVVVYTVNEGGAAHIGYRVVEASGATGAQMLADGGAGLADASMPAALGTCHLAREAMLRIFSESVENQAQVIGSIAHGIDFAPWN